MVVRQIWKDPGTQQESNKSLEKVLLPSGLISSFVFKMETIFFIFCTSSSRKICSYTKCKNTTTCQLVCIGLRATCHRVQDSMLMPAYSFIELLMWLLELSTNIQPTDVLPTTYSVSMHCRLAAKSMASLN